jgi:hypothetical protein
MVKAKKMREKMMVNSKAVFDSNFFMCLVLMVSEGVDHASHGQFPFRLD